jgi:hypothetical protein
MKRRRGAFEVFSLSAIDLFASAMGAFVIIAIILMPDYQKEVRSQGDLLFLEELAGKTEAILTETELGQKDTLEALQAAMTRYERLLARQETISSELDIVNAELQARHDEMPPPPPSPVITPEDIASHQVTFRFLGLKTDETRFLFLVDMNRYLAPHETLVANTVMRALGALHETYEFSIIGFQQVGSGPKYHRWPADGSLVHATSGNKDQAERFLSGLSGSYYGASSVLEALRTGLKSPADALILISDGLPNPVYNDGLTPKRIVQEISIANAQDKEIHAVTIGDYFKYKGTIEFMEALAWANQGGFIALAD